ncbi:MAG: glycosyltransferase family 2 protein [Pedobacter sp.]
MSPAKQDTAPTRLPLSVVIIAKNEAERIEECLASITWADEIVVVDSGSTDATCDIARRYTDRVHFIPWQGFGPQKQATVDLASHEWILNVDCDERVTLELAAEIRQILSLPPPQGAYSIPRRTFLGRKEIKQCGWYPDRTIRLFDRTKSRYSDSLVHERVITDGAIGACSEHLLHYSFTGLSQLLAKLNNYSDLSARQMFDQGRRCSLFDLTVRPLFAFFKTYLLKTGIFDGVEGLVISVTTAMLTFAKYTKLRELNNQDSDNQP